MKEIWKDVPWYEWLYRASTGWRIMSINNRNRSKNLIMKQQRNTRGYSRIMLSIAGVWKRFQVHRIILKTFIWWSKLQVNHIDWDKQNNTLENLEYCTQKQNIKHWWKNWLYKVKNNRKIKQFTKNHIFIKEWFSAREIERQLWIWNQNIPKACNGRIKTLWGFIWKYSE